MNFDEYIYEYIKHFENLNILDKFIYNAEHYCEYPNETIDSSLIDCLFIWAKTEEGREYWYNIHNNLSIDLKISYFPIKRIEVIDILKSKQNNPTDKLSYEYW